MRKLIFISIAAFSMLISALVHADEGPPRPHQQHPNVPNDEQQYPAPSQEQMGAPIYNQNYRFNGGGQFLAPGYGIPQNFVCNTCAVIVNWNWAEVIAYGGYGAYRIWAGPTQWLIPAVNTIKAQTGMCQNLPFLPPPPVAVPVPPIAPAPPIYRPGFPGYPPGMPGRPGWGPHPMPYVR